jgi:hypothetical protein
MSRDYMPEDFREESGAPSSATPRLDIQPIRARGRSIDPFPETHRRTQDTVLRGRADRLCASERRTLAELGRFRLISTEDLARHVYEGRRQEMEQDVRNLVRQGLIQREALEGLDGTGRQMLTLTTHGHRLIRANRLVGDSESIDHIAFKPKEAVHDADLYRLYQKGAARVEAEGGTNLRIVFEWEIDKKLRRDLLARSGETREQIASRYGLRMVGEKIPVPDLRIEYQTREGELAHVDLELVTEHYRAGYLAEKARAGFSLYAPRSEAGRLRGALRRQGLTTEILSL